MPGSIPHQRRLIAYVNDPRAVHGAGPLFEQKRAIEAVVAMMGATVARWCVDSGRRFPGQRCGDALLRLLGEAREGDTVVVSRFSDLGADDEAVAAVAGTMAMFGVAVIAASGVVVAPAPGSRGARAGWRWPAGTLDRSAPALTMAAGS